MKSQQVLGEQQPPLTGSASHGKWGKIISASLSTLTFSVTVQPAPLPTLMRDAFWVRMTMAAAKLLASEVHTVRAHVSPRGTCVKNSWIILAKYLNVKPKAHIIYVESSKTGRVARVKREEHNSRDESEVFSSRVAPVVHILLVSLMIHAQEQCRL